MRMHDIERIVQLHSHGQHAWDGYVTSWSEAAVSQETSAYCREKRRRYERVDFVVETRELGPASA